ncbi:MAG: diaminopimelate decarboxylase family protein, partial [bacterium]
MTDEFTRKNGQLFCEELSVQKLAEKYGSPLYLYSRNHYLQRVQEFKDALKGLDHLVCFAVKACSNLSILSDLAGVGCGFDIISGGELNRVKKAGADPEKIVYAGVGKKKAEQKLALENDIYLFNVESMPELAQLNEVARSLG